MFQRIKKAGILPIVLGLSACSSPKDNPAAKLGQVNAASIASNENLTPSEKSEALAKASEQLITNQGFAYANDVADLALQQDANNLRAQFIKASLAPLLAQKGILVRIKPLYYKDPEAKASYDKMMAEFEQKTPNSTFKSFLLDGRPDIENEADLQDYLDSVADGFKAIREFAKKNKSSELTVMTSDSFFESMNNRYAEACQIVETSKYEYEFNCPSILNLMEVTLNRADFEVLQNMAAGYEVYFSLMNSYNLTGAIQVAQNHKGDSSSAPVAKILDELLKNSKFGTIRNHNGFKKIKDMGIDATSGIRWVMANQNSLCPMGRENVRNRLGALFNRGLCIDQNSSAELAQSIKRAEDALSGGMIDINVSNGFQTYVAQIKPTSIMDSPIADIRSLMPMQFNKCNQVINVGDSAIGGLFPNKDANAVLQISNQCPN